MKLLISILMIFGFAVSYAEDSSEESPPLKSRQEIREYLNSLSVEELQRLHILRQKIRHDFKRSLGIKMLAVSGLGVAIGVVAMGAGVHALQDRYPAVEFKERRKTFRVSNDFLYKVHKYVTLPSLFLVIAALYVEGLRSEGLGLKGVADPYDEANKYIDSLTLSQLETLSESIKEMLSALEK